LRERHTIIIDDIVKSPQTVIPAKAGIQNYLKNWTPVDAAVAMAGVMMKKLKSMR
jgi:phosphoribosylpyrophosphate synthetase